MEKLHVLHDLWIKFFTGGAASIKMIKQIQKNNFVRIHKFRVRGMISCLVEFGNSSTGTYKLKKQKNHTFHSWDLLYSYYCFPVLEQQAVVISDEDFSYCSVLQCNGVPHINSWEPERLYHYWTMFHWEPEGHYHHRDCTVIAPFWFSTEHHWIVIMLLWLSTDDK